MTREEAIKVVRNIYQTDAEKEALAVLVPELSESEDEKIIRAIINALYSHTNSINLLSSRGYQMGNIEAWLEKQKDGSKAIEAVERIDEYIDEHLANAYDMKDSNPSKKYYCGWDDALAEMSGILQDVYSGKKQKPAECIPDYVKFEEGFKTGRELGFREGVESIKPAEWTGEDEDMLRDIFSDLLAGSAFNTEFQTIAKKKINWLKTRLKSCRPLLSSEWGEEDDRPFNNVLNGLKYAYEDLTNHKSYDSAKDVKEAYDWMVSRFKYFCPNLQPKQEWSEEEKKFIKHCAELLDAQGEPMCALRLESLRSQPHWKPSEGQMEALKECGECKRCIKELYEDLQKRYGTC